MGNITKSFIKEEKSNLNYKIEKDWNLKIRDKLIELMHSSEGIKPLNDYIVDIYYSMPMVHTLNKSFTKKVDKIKDLESDMHKRLVDFIKSFKDEITRVESLSPTPKEEVERNKIKNKEDEVSKLNINLSPSDLKEIDTFLIKYNEPQKEQTIKYFLNIKEEFISSSKNGLTEDFSKKYGKDSIALGKSLRYRSEDKIIKDIEDDFLSKRSKLKTQIIRETNKVSSGLKFLNVDIFPNSNGSFDGCVEFNNLNIHITTIVASGYVQKPHYRTLLNSHELSNESSLSVDECLAKVKKQEAKSNIKSSSGIGLK